MELAMKEPSVEDLPFVIRKIEEAISYSRFVYLSPEQVDMLVAGLEACYRSMKKWVHIYIGEWTSHEIEVYGAELSAIDKKLEMAADELHKYGRIHECVGDMGGAIMGMKKVWNKMDDLGLTT